MQNEVKSIIIVITSAQIPWFLLPQCRENLTQLWCSHFNSWYFTCHFSERPTTNLVIQVQAAKAWHRLGKLSEFCNCLHRCALAAVEDANFRILVEQPSCSANHLSHQSLFSQLQSLHVMDDKWLENNKNEWMIEENKKQNSCSL